ncbi:hypothetical protein BJF85_25185 [Saccharomonospora sp. CUA-673]|uniref:hypothetical protein n=1 Tax=Saccharomonospora sp. CUA-673 TaxID=1904969 RepID=UPI00095FBA97|nr:hypothetical protein [Saccharomonospora sp. CUA-673]OLT40331.1 hypothetical protein BJF85_25185 [Saccharomonospora sp. CUA-673]
MTGDPWQAAVLAHHQDELRRELAAIAAPLNRATLTLYLHVLGHTLDYLAAHAVGDMLPVARVHDTGLDWFTVRIAATCQLALDEGLTH